MFFLGCSLQGNTDPTVESAISQISVTNNNKQETEQTMIGKILDERYELIKKIGSGGMADVYMAKDILLDRVVAVKILHGNFAEDEDFVLRFRHEAQSAGKLDRKSVV